MLYRGSIFRRDFIQNLIQTKEKDHSSGASQSREKKVSLVLRNNSVFVFREKNFTFSRPPAEKPKPEPKAKLVEEPKPKSEPKPKAEPKKPQTSPKKK